MTLGNEQQLNSSGFGFRPMTQRLKTPAVALIKLIYATIVANVHR